MYILTGMQWLVFLKLSKKGLTSYILLAALLI